MKLKINPRPLSGGREPCQFKSPPILECVRTSYQLNNTVDLPVIFHLCDSVGSQFSVYLCLCRNTDAPMSGTGMSFFRYESEERTEVLRRFYIDKINILLTVV